MDKRKPSMTMGERANNTLGLGAVSVLVAGVSGFWAYFVAESLISPGDLPSSVVIIWIVLVFLLGRLVFLVAAYARAWFVVTEKDALRRGMVEGGADHIVLVALLCIISLIVQTA
ncbi:MAG: hypothetical protein ACR2P4_09345, partial [Gammaproteobacteria bacterium]